MLHKQGENRDQMFMFSLESAIAADSFVRVVDAFVNAIDLKSFGFAHVEGYFNNISHEWKWAKRKHPNKCSYWIKNQYFISKGKQNWAFEATGNKKHIVLPQFDATKIVRHTKIITTQILMMRSGKITLLKEVENDLLN
jgi:hypothetical protein